MKSRFDPIRSVCYRHVKLPFVVWAILLFTSLTFPVRAAGRHAMQDARPAAVTQLPSVDRLPPTKRLDLTIALPLRNREALSNLLQQIYDPTSTNFHSYLTPKQFAEQFCPTESDYQALTDFARSNDLTISETHPNRTLLHVHGAARDIERIFKLQMRIYRHPTEGRNFFAPDTEPSLDVPVPILAINGLDDFDLPHPMNLNTNFFHQPLDVTANTTGSGPRGNFIGKNFRTAYAPGVTLDGTGQAVGLFELDGYFPSDITAYENLAGLPSVTLTNVLVDGTLGNPGSQNNEVALDIDMAIAMAPGLARVIVYEGVGSTPNDILNRMATDNLASQLSSSWGFGPKVDAPREQIFQQFAAQGQSFFQASGDSGGGQISQPSDDAYVTVVGGTSLTTSASGAWAAESAWQQSAGGISKNYALPLWQQGISMSNNLGSTTFRNVPDVACLGDVQIWLIANNGDQGAIGGTSAAAPLWAGFAALANQQAAVTGKPNIGFINPLVYLIGQSSQYTNCFHDIITGNTTNASSPTKFFAVPGYDLCTGWGTPNGSNLINALLAPPDALLVAPSTNVVFAGPVGGPFVPTTQSYSVTNRGATNLNWTVSSSIPWLEVPPVSGSLIPGGAATTFAVRPSSAANNLAAGSYTGSFSFINLTDGFMQSRQVSLQAVASPVITAQPANVNAFEGMTTTFTVGTATNGSINFQWRQDNGTVLTNLANGGNVSGATSSTLTISNVSAANVGTYSVILSNVAGVVTSSNAFMSIVPSRPVILAAPLSQSALPGQNLTLNVSAAGTQPLTYQWKLNGTNLADGGNLSGTTTSSLAIHNLITANAGTYSVLVANSLGSTNSVGALLTVTPATQTGVNLTTLYSFTGGNDGGNPNGLTLAANQNLYGTTQSGGVSAAGTVFQMPANGAPTTLYSFTGGNDGATPFDALLAGADGNFYGTTFQGGTNDNGTVFSITPGGALTTLVIFTNGNGDLPYSGIIFGADNNFYGTSYQGGTIGRGTVYKMAPNGALTTLYSFSNSVDGGQPYAGLIQGSDNNLYGTTYKGGSNSDGTVFKISTNGALTTLVHFNSTNGAFPYAGLIQDASGNYYGTTSQGGAHGNGTIFKLTSAGVLSNMYSFSGIDGANPHASLLLGSDGNLYGTTANGGTFGDGTAFLISPDGVFVTLVNFDGFTGASPQSPLIQTADGNIYGTTQYGGVSGNGVIFHVGINSAPQLESQPASQTAFLGANVIMSVSVLGSVPLSYQWQKNGSNLIDGSGIFGSNNRILNLNNVTAASAGTYSVVVTNALGLTNSAGALLTITSSPPFFVQQPTNQTVGAGATVTINASVLGNFPLTYQWQLNGTNLVDHGNVAGSATSSIVINNATEGNNGNYTLMVSNSLSTITSSNAVLTVVSPTTGGSAITLLHWFGDATGGGAAPNGLMRGNDGNLYGTTQFGTATTLSGLGTIFKVTTNGAFTTLLSFSGSTGATLGGVPLSALVQDTNNNFFGMTELGGINSDGNIFEYKADTTFSNLYSFAGGSDGLDPANPLIIGTDGNLYGVTPQGGTFGNGNIFRISPNGAFTNLYSFTGGSDGFTPSGGLLEATDGNFYGVTGSGGASTNGTIFRFTTNGVLTSLHSFTSADGYLPIGSLIQAADGNLYGVTEHNTINNLQFYGTIYKITTNGALNTLYSLNFSDGAYPLAGLIQGSDGNFYGTTSTGANSSNGTVFVISPLGTLATLVVFDGFDDGAHPASALVEGPDGAFYGTTPSGGPSGRGTIFRVTLTTAPQITAPPTNLTVFAGTRATFSVAIYGARQLFYQWQRNGTNLVEGGKISGSTSRILTLNNVSLADAATNYSVTISNSLGTVTSSNVTLNVIGLPVFQSIVVTNTSVSLKWSAVAGQKYQLQANAGLNPTTWTNVDSTVTATNSLVSALDNTGSNSRHFYRVAIVP